MTSKGKKEAKETAVALPAEITYPALSSGQRILTILKETLEGETLNIADLDRIGVPAAGGQSWSYQQGGQDISSKTLTGVIVHHTPVRLYWTKAYGVGEKTPPDCFSKDGITGEGTPGGACFSCPLSKWDKTLASNGKEKGTACQLRRMLFILLPGEFLPRTISVPPMSFDISKKYLVDLTTQGLSNARVLTELGLARAQNSGSIAYSTVSFRMAGKLPDEQATRAMTYGQQLRAVMSRSGSQDMVTQNTNEPVIEELPA